MKLKRLLCAAAAVLLLGSCASIPPDGYGYGGAPYPGYVYSDPYPYWGYGFGYAPYYWGPPVIVGGAFFFRGGPAHGWHHAGRGDGTHWRDHGGRHWGGGGPGGRFGGGDGGHRGGGRGGR